MIEIVPRQAEVLIEAVGFGGVHIGAVAIKSLVRWWLRLAYILIVWAFQAIPEVYNVFASAIQVVSYLEFFPGVVARKRFR